MIKKIKVIKKKYIILIFVIICFCRCNNKKEQLPSYIAIDAVKVETNYSKEGTALHGICDSWIIVDYKDIGIFENPTKNIPVLASGMQHIEILPGIKENGSSSYHVVYPMMERYVIDTILKEKEIAKIKPKFQYKENVVFALLEDFDKVGNYFQEAENSVPMKIIFDEELLEKRCMYFSLEKENDQFECRSVNLISLPTNGSDVYLELNYRCNGSFIFGFFDRQGTTNQIEVRVNVYHINPSNNQWKKVYVNLKTHLYNAKGKEFRPFFIASKNNNNVDKVEVYIDNIKILYK